jgi:hypothetical protein
VYNAEYVLELLNFHSQELTLDDLVEIWKQSPLKKLRNLSLNLKRGP